METDTGADMETDTGMDTGTDTEMGTGQGTETGTGQDTGAGPGPGPGMGTGTGPGTGTGQGMGPGPGPGMGTGPGTGPGTGTGTGMGMGTDDMDERSWRASARAAQEIAVEEEMMDKNDLRAALLEIAALRGNIIRSMNWSGEPYEAGCLMAFSRCADIADSALENWRDE